MPIWSYLGLRKLSSEGLCIQSWFKGWKSFHTFAKNADVFYDIVDFFCALKHCSELSKFRTGLNPGNEARPINPFPSFIFWLSFHFSRGQNRSFFAAKKQTETLATQVISDVPLLSEIFRWNNSTQKAVFRFYILPSLVIRNLSVNGPRSNPLPSCLYDVSHFWQKKR